MKKIVGLTATFALALSTACFASPSMDYNQGATSIDLSVSSASVTPDYGSKLDGSSSLSGAITTGLGGDFALQYKYNNYKTDDPTVKSQEFNLLYKLDKGLAVFAGDVRNEMTYTNTVNGLQVGLIGTVPIAERTNAYGIVGTGNKINSYEVGIGYQIAKNTELNVAYRDAKFKDFDSGDVTVKGMSYGISYKF